MGARGRKSAADLAVVNADTLASVEVEPRPLPPRELTDEQAAEWRMIVDAQAAGWLTRDRYPMLIALCRHVVAQRHIAQLVEQSMDAGEEFDLKDHDRLLKMQERESRCILAASVRLRIADAAIYKPKEGNAKAIAPWRQEKRADAG